MSYIVYSEESKDQELEFGSQVRVLYLVNRIAWGKIEARKLLAGSRGVLSYALNGLYKTVGQASPVFTRAGPPIYFLR